MESATSQSSQPPLFTVVIPTYRRDDFLRDAISSVLAQTFPDYEIIVVDDAPDSSTASVVAAFGDPRITYLKNSRSKGGAGTRNTGAALARGAWIAFLDDDDTWLPQKLESIATIVSADNAELGLVYSGRSRYDFNRGRTLQTQLPTVRGRVLDEVLYSNCIGGLSVAVVRREAFEKLGGFDERFPALQDVELYVRVAQQYLFDYVEQPLVRIRVSTRRQITSDATKKFVGSKLFAEKYEDLLNSDVRLRHRTAARTLLFALAVNDFREAARNASWTLAGIFVDPTNFLFFLKSLAKQYRIRRKRLGGAVTPETG